MMPNELHGVNNDCPFIDLLAKCKSPLASVKLDLLASLVSLKFILFPPLTQQFVKSYPIFSSLKPQFRHENTRRFSGTQQPRIHDPTLTLLINVRVRPRKVRRRV